jgi:uncharacterized membrane protein YbhN (UPF0104 family)
MKKYIKTLLALSIVTATICLFVYYLSHHPETVRQIQHMPLLTLVGIVVLYGVWFAAYALVTRGSLALYNKHMGVQENILFNAYSNLINFFGPGQSGPIFRGAYLKKRHNLGVKPFIFSMLIYYAFYGVISVLMMFIGTRPWWQTTVLILAASAGSLYIIRWYKRKYSAKMGGQLSLSATHIGWICAATAAQLITQAVIFGIELHNAGAHASVGQVLAYTGVANFALFVALTPGAIGIRESFLLFSQNLHHIPSSTIVAANVIDRGVYLIFLGVLFVLVLSLHAKDKLGVNQLPQEAEK